MNTQNWHKGDVLLEQYEVLGTLGEGGMGTVYKVHHRGWNIDLAVKSPQPEIFAREEGKENFIREAETWVNLPLHPHIVSCYYVRLIDEVPRIFAEYVAGGSLGDWIRSRRLYEGGHQQALERMLDLAIQFAWGLHAAHEQGLVHQDIKPANVMMTLDGVVKVTDFGLAKARVMAGEQEGSNGGNSQHSILVSSRGMTPAYCSPEQAAGKALSRKTDIWSWGVSLLEMWGGEVTWRSGILAREVLASYEPQDVAIPPLPAGLVKLLARCFEPRPEDRPSTMLEVATTLQEIYAHEIGQAYPREAPQVAKMQADTLNNRALSLYDLGKVEEALQVWEQALKVNPQHLDATYNRGVALWRRGGLTDDALVHQLERVRPGQAAPGWAEYLLAQVHLERGDVRAAQSLLKEAVHQAPIASLTQALLKRIQARIVMGNYNGPTFLQGSTERVNAVSLSADGRWLASGSRDGMIRLWETSSGRCVHTFQSHTLPVESVCLSGDGRWLVSGSGDKTVRLWEVSSGRCLHTLQGHTHSVNAVSLSADGRFLASGSRDGMVRLWEVSSGRCLHVLQDHAESIESVSLSADGYLLASGSADQTVRLWEVSSGRCLHTLQGHTQSVKAVSLSADGRWLASAGWDKTVRLWEASSGRCLHTLQGHTGLVGSVSLSADGRWLASAGWDQTVRLWEASSGRCLHTLQGYEERVSPSFSARRLVECGSVSLSADGRRLASGGADQTVWLWEHHEQNIPGALHISQVHSSTNVAQVEGRAEWLLKRIEQEQAAGKYPDALSQAQKLRALSGWERNPKSMEAWARLALHCSRVSVRAGWLARNFQGHTSAVNAVSLSADGRFLASGSRDGMVRLWEVSSGRCLHILQDHANSIESVSLSADGRFLVSGSNDQTVRLWELSSGRCLRTFQGHSEGVSSVNLSTDGRFLVSGSSGQTVRLWELSSGRCLRTFQGHSEVVSSVSLSADGSWLASAGWDQTVRLWEVSSGRCLQILQDYSDPVSSVSLSADGRWLVSGSWDQTVRLWEVSSKRYLHIFRGHTEGIMSVSLSADGRFLVSGSNDRTVRLWEVSSGRCLHIFRGHSDRVSSVSLSADGRWLVSGSWDQTICLWELDWELEAHEPAEWDEGARPYLETFLTLRTPYAAKLPHDREPTEQEIQQALTRKGIPTWNEEDFQGLIRQLQYVGYGWLRPEGVRKQLASMVGERQSPSHSLNKE